MGTHGILCFFYVPMISGVSDNCNMDKRFLNTADDLFSAIDAEGFLPLFGNAVTGFSVEDRTPFGGWWTGLEEIDPWEWRIIAARSGRVAYSKFFDGRAGFISLDWFPVFANWKRDGYDFDALYDDGKATLRQKKIMDVFMNGEEHFSFEAKRLAGFGKDGEKNFEGIVTGLEKATYLVIKDFRRRINKKGGEYGWHIAVLSSPEGIWGYDAVTSSYAEDPELSYQKIMDHLALLYPGTSPEEIMDVLGGSAVLKG